MRSWNERTEKIKQKFSLLSDKNTLVSVQGSEIRMQIDKEEAKNGFDKHFIARFQHTAHM